MSELYINGFNEGYVLAKRRPALAQAISNFEDVSPRLKGFRDGRRQFLLEQTKKRGVSWLTCDEKPIQTQKPDRN